MEKLKITLILVVINLASIGVMISQNTFGTILYTEDVADGYTLFTLHKQTFLIDNCGQVINQWSSEYTPGNAVYLLEDGSILRTGNTNSSDITFGGNGGIVEKFSWEGDLLWSYTYDTPQYRQHHDIYPLPNGNVLILAATVISENEAIELGRDPSKLVSGRLFNERIIEVEPEGTAGGTIVWEWNFIDHTIQDFDSNKANFGVIADNPQRVDINFLNGSDGVENWLHINSIQYDVLRDQIIMSSRKLSEIYIIDHSTTTVEAASSNGGVYGKGGDFLYRWGNPQAYDQGTGEDQQLIGQHTPYIIPNGFREEGNILVFNNRASSDPQESEVNILELPETATGMYEYVAGTSYAPVAPKYTYKNIGFFSPIVSGAQMLPNGNILICEGRQGEIFELDSADNIVWNYIVPYDNRNGNTATQGEGLSSVNNLTFRATKFSPDYPAFSGRDLSPGDPIENNPNISSCLTLSDNEINLSDFAMYPNPVKDLLYVKSEDHDLSFHLYDIKGKLLKSDNSKTDFIDLSDLSSGIYLIKFQSDKNSITKRIIKY